MILLQLYFEFFKTGLFAVGGGLATLPFLYRISDNFGWVDYRQIADLIAVSESTPGPIGVNAATYMGFHTAGFVGGAIATLGLITPSIIIIILIAKALDAFKRSAAVKAVFAGLRPAATGLIAAAGFSVMKIELYNEGRTGILDLVRYRETALFIVLLILIMKLKKHPIVYIAAAAVIGIVLSL